MGFVSSEEEVMSIASAALTSANVVNVVDVDVLIVFLQVIILIKSSPYPTSSLRKGRKGFLPFFHE